MEDEERLKKLEAGKAKVGGGREAEGGAGRPGADCHRGRAGRRSAAAAGGSARGPAANKAAGGGALCCPACAPGLPPLAWGGAGLSRVPRPGCGWPVTAGPTRCTLQVSRAGGARAVPAAPAAAGGGRAEEGQS